MNKIEELKIFKNTKEYNEVQTTSARDLHDYLGIKRDFSTWFKERSTRYGFSLDKDYVKYFTNKNSKNHGGHNRIDYSISTDMAKRIIEIENARTTDKNRAELNFGEMLEQIIGVSFEKQYVVCDGKYRIDFYYPNILIVEYDEEHHKNTAKEDHDRIIEIREWLHAQSDEDDNCKWRCPVIRVKKGDEYSGLNRIIKHLVGFEVLDSYNYDFEPCDYDNGIFSDRK